MSQYIEKRICSDFNIIKDTVNEILTDIDIQLSDGIVFAVKLVLNELIINCVKHGNQNNINKFIYINLDINLDRIKISVQDEGAGIIYDRHNQSLMHSESGRGLMLVEGLTDKMIIRNNTVVCFINL